MNRATRDKFVATTDYRDLTRGNACLETPPAFFAQLNRDFGPFDLDLTADPLRALCPRWFGPGASDPALADVLAVPDWGIYGSCAYANPAYGRFVDALLAKAAEAAEGWVSTLLLLPVRMKRAIHREVLRMESGVDLLFCDRRIAFFENGIPRLNQEQWTTRRRAVADAALFDSMLVHFDPGRRRRRMHARVWSYHVEPHVMPEDLDRAITIQLAKEEAERT